MKYAHTETDLPIEDKYPKLIRDKIPELVESQGKKAEVKVLTKDDEYLDFLFSKLVEESTELAHAENESNQHEELADVFEVLEAILELKKLSRSDITTVQEQKRQARGGFKDRLLMLSKP
jgi:predicted house-cleaning noncanonical NTP pyrophosphatase (MazG superfamily)